MNNIYNHIVHLYDDNVTSKYHEVHRAAGYDVDAIICDRKIEITIVLTPDI